MYAAASSSSSTIASVEVSSYRANRGRPARNSIPPLGSTTHSATNPARTSGARSRTSDHSTDPLPAPVDPATSTWVATRFNRHVVRSSLRPSGSTRSTANASTPDGTPDVTPEGARGTAGSVPASSATACTGTGRAAEGGAGSGGSGAGGIGSTRGSRTKNRTSTQPGPSSQTEQRSAR